MLIIDEHCLHLYHFTIILFSLVGPLLSGGQLVVVQEMHQFGEEEGVGVVGAGQLDHPVKNLE